MKILLYCLKKTLKLTQKTSKDSFFGGTLLQGLTRFSATHTGCRWLISYIEQKKFLAWGPEFSVEFSAPPEFSGGVTEKYLSTGWARTFDLQDRKQIFYHCATAPLYSRSHDIHCLPSWDFPAVSVGTGSRIFRPYLVVTCRDLPAVSAVTGSRIFRPYQVVTCGDFPAVSAVTGSRIFRPYLYLLAGIFWPYLFWHQKAGIFRPYLLFLAGIFRP